MTGELIQTPSAGPVLDRPLRLPPVPWRDPHTVSSAKLKEYIGALEQACQQNPLSADLRTCLGMAYAMNYEVYKSEAALERAIELEPDHFFAKLKYAELHYRLRALIRAEQETLKALELAGNHFELSLARKQLQEIRKLMREGTQKPEWTKPLTRPALVLLVMTIFLCLAVHWK
jgi:tetratricopeptide (TPR) repeat protein